jgi:arginine/lysine/ornithine decarboxylase
MRPGGLTLQSILYPNQKVSASMVARMNQLTMKNAHTSAHQDVVASMDVAPSPAMSLDYGAQMRSLSSAPYFVREGVAAPTRFSIRL